MERKITILSIDDEENIRFALGELFHFQGWEACSAPNVKKGDRKSTRLNSSH